MFTQKPRLLMILSVVIAYNWCFPAVRLCKKHGRESGVTFIFYEKIAWIYRTKIWLVLLIEQ